MEKIFFHIDVNSAFLSWTSVENLKTGAGIDLREIPSIIGGDSSKRHGIVLAKSIPAKKYHIQTAEPIGSALKKCPSLVIAPPDHAMYHRYSQALMAHLSSFCPDLEQVSIDECYMDYTPIASRYDSPTAAAALIKDSVYEQLGFTVNVGISDRKVLAKMASDFRKPNLVHTLFCSELKEKLWPLPISSLFLCGRSSSETLRKLGIVTIGDLARSDPAIVTAHLKSHGQTLWNYANGIDDSEVVTQEAEAKGIGNSTTLSTDVSSPAEARRVLLWLSESVAARLREAKKRAACVTVEIKYASFVSVSHQTMLDTPASSTDFLYETACRLFRELWNGEPIRLLGLRTTKLCAEDEPIQLSLFDLPDAMGSSRTADATRTDAHASLPHTGISASADPAGAVPSSAHADVPFSLAQMEKRQKLDQALDSIRNRYGNDSVVRGSLYQPRKKDFR
ncbi:MAG: DNA polymerase IV [bacterium]|nr:DNA polymerase IV [bacterium]